MTIGTIATSRTNRKRYLWLDYVKSIGIFLIVYGHFPSNKFVSSFLWTFHVPLFFFVAGFLSVSNSQEFNIHKKIERLLLPYVYLYLISVVISFTLKSIGGKPFDILVFLKSLMGLFWASDGYAYFINTPLWFLPSLFTVDLIFNLFKKNFWLLIVCPLVSLFLYTHGVLNTFLSFDLSLLGLNYYFLGYLIRTQNLINRLQENSKLALLGLGIVALLLVLLFAKYNNVWYAGTSVHAYFFSFIGGAFGCLMVVAVSLLLEQVMGELKPVTYISQNTLLILGFHLFSNRYAYGLISFFGFIPSILRTLFATILSILMLLPVIILINKAFPQIGGRRPNLKSL